MDKNLYDLMDWAGIEGIVYSDGDKPQEILGPHPVKGGLLIQAFLPKASSVVAVLFGDNQEFPMELMDEEGFFAVHIPEKAYAKNGLKRAKEKKIPSYFYRITYDNGYVEETRDPYAFEPYIDAVDISRFSAGTHDEIYNYLGSHVMEREGVKGTLFAVWAPNAVRVSVVGDFNLWDGRKHQMGRLQGSGIFELFIPNIDAGTVYKYEIKIKGDAVKLKSDPYGNQMELRPGNASIVCDLSNYQWKDEKWMQERKKSNPKEKPMSVYEVHLGSFKRREAAEEETGFYNYRELAHALADYLKEMNYTHVELMPVMEHPLDASWGYQVTGYYAATSRYGTPEDLMYLVDYLHEKGIGVIFDWVPAHFPKDSSGLAEFDGTCLYEHQDKRQGYHPHWGTLIYNFGRPEVSNFLKANALFWLDKFHADGIRMDAVASMLYLDYGKEAGEWVANIYGGNENLEAIELLRQLSEVFHRKGDGALLIAEESTSWPKVTGSVSEDGLGFDYKWNMGWMNDFLDYMQTDPLFRRGKHGELTFSLCYTYSENFILPFSHDEVVHGKKSLLYKMPGDTEQKFANLRLAYGFMMAHPGRKHLFMGQEFAQPNEWDEKKELDWGIIESNQKHKQMQDYVKALNEFYRKHPALYEMDAVREGFEWISCLDADHSLIAFVRHAKKEDLLIICNFTPVVHTDLQIGVPYKGKYKEIFNSDAECYGGSGYLNPRMKQSKAEVWEDRDNSIKITIPPLGVTVFSCTRIEEGKETAKGSAAVKKTPVSRKKTGKEGRNA